MISVMAFATYAIIGFMLTSLAIVSLLLVVEMYKERKRRKDND